MSLALNLWGFSDPQAAFQCGLKNGIFTMETVSNYMYMGDNDGHHLFKHRITREYIKCAI